MAEFFPGVVRRLVDAAARSRCKKSQRGAILVTRDRLDVFTGANWPAAGECNDSDLCRMDCSKICVHAEQVALLSAGRADVRGADVYHLKVVDGEPVHSGTPSCVECSKLMLQAGVANVWLYTVNGWVSWTAEEFHRATLRKCMLAGGI